jgi:hypothetical protein
VFQYGAPGWLPVAGDWTGSGHAGIGTVDPASMTWYLRNSPSAGTPDISPFAYGAAGWTPVVGDWTGSGKTTVGVVDPGSGTWYLPSASASGGVAQFAYGAAGWTPVALDMQQAVPTNPIIPQTKPTNPQTKPTNPQTKPTNPQTAGAPVISLAPSSLVLTRSADGNSASGVLTITNSGPASSSLSYQLSGSITVPSFPNLQLTADHPTGQLSGGQSEQVQISTSGLNSLYLGTFTGTLTVSDQNGAAASQQIPISVTVGSSTGSTATFRGTVTFSYHVNDILAPRNQQLVTLTSSNFTLNLLHQSNGSWTFDPANPGGGDFIQSPSSVVLGDPGDGLAYNASGHYDVTLTNPSNVPSLNGTVVTLHFSGGDNPDYGINGFNFQGMFTTGNAFTGFISHNPNDAPDQATITTSSGAGTTLGNGALRLV